MDKLKNLYCIVGESGSGKTTIVDKLAEKFGYTVLKSFTTRAPRNEGDTDHTFISLEEYDNLQNKVATCEFNGAFYCATAEQVEDSDLYVIDCDGIRELKEKYHGTKEIVVIYINTPMDIRLERMLKRGDGDKAWERLKHDYDAFRNVRGLANHTVNGIPEQCWFDVAYIIDAKEG
jgi:guanylate kinase